MIQLVSSHFNSLSLDCFSLSKLNFFLEHFSCWHFVRRAHSFYLSTNQPPKQTSQGRSKTNTFCDWPRATKYPSQSYGFLKTKPFSNNFTIWPGLYAYLNMLESQKILHYKHHICHQQHLHYKCICQYHYMKHYLILVHYNYKLKIQTKNIHKSKIFIMICNKYLGLMFWNISYCYAYLNM